MSLKKPIRIAMWSGPRNISTAMMRSWENRADTQVVDEPFYACYLTETGIVHPMQQEILGSQSSNWQQVIKQSLSSPLESQQTIQYQKHMTHHMVVDIDRTWFASLRNAFLIRHPERVVASYSQKRGSFSAEELGFKKQYEIFSMALETLESPPVVIDSVEILKQPEKALNKLCLALDVPFDKNMLSWPAGKRDSDGVWAAHWYQNVEASTGFAPFSDKAITLNAEAKRVVKECLPYYEKMADKQINI